MSTLNATGQKIARTILSQLGGNRFTAMTGAKHLMGLPTGLSFRFMPSKKVNYCEIHLNGKDLYDVRFGAIKGGRYVIMSDHADVYAEDLRTLFESTTGLATKL